MASSLPPLARPNLQMATVSGATRAAAPGGGSGAAARQRRASMVMAKPQGGSMMDGQRMADLAMLQYRQLGQKTRLMHERRVKMDAQIEADEKALQHIDTQAGQLRKKYDPLCARLLGQHAERDKLQSALDHAKATVAGYLKTQEEQMRIIVRDNLYVKPRTTTALLLLLRLLLLLSLPSALLLILQLLLLPLPLPLLPLILQN